MRVPNLLAEPWAVHRPAFDSIVQTAREGGSIGHVKASALGVSVEALGRLLDVAPESQLDVRDGIAVIPVAGYLTRRPYWRGDQAAYEWIGEQVSAAHERRDVRGIVLEVDSGGGQVNGTDELARLIREVRADKPVTAYVLGQATSAAYWIASAASRIVVGRTSMVGSIGVMMTFVDWSKYDAEIGIQEITIVSSQSPDKDLDPSTESGRALVQATVDQLAGVFVADVAEGRGVDESTVISDFGGGWVLVGEAAVSAGMADQVGSFDDAIPPATSGFNPTTPGAPGQEASMMHRTSIVTSRAKPLRVAEPPVVGKPASPVQSSAAAITVAVRRERARVIGILDEARKLGGEAAYQDALAMLSDERVTPAVASKRLASKTAAAKNLGERAARLRRVAVAVGFEGDDIDGELERRDASAASMDSELERDCVPAALRSTVAMVRREWDPGFGV